MININLYTDKKKGFISAFSVEGHAGYAPHGQDIVCAAVSALSISTVYALGDAGRAKTEEREGFIFCEIKSPDLASYNLTRAFVLGVQEIETQYKEFVKVHLFET